MMNSPNFFFFFEKKSEALTVKVAEDPYKSWNLISGRQF